MKTLDGLKADWVLGTEMHKLEARLWRHVLEDEVGVLLVTSATRGEGKSTTCAYLATVLGQYPDRRVLAIDLDLRAPRLGEYLGLTPERSVGEVLQGGCEWKKAVTPTELPKLCTLLPNPMGEDSSALLNTPELFRMVRETRETFDLVIIDAPAVLPVADTSLIIPHVDGVLLVAMAGQTTKPNLEKARDLCLGLGASILGLVVGNLHEADPDYRYYGGYRGYDNDRIDAATRGNGSGPTTASSGREAAADATIEEEGSLP